MRFGLVHSLAAGRAQQCVVVQRGYDARPAFAREARQMNLVRPGERLFIVKGIPEWRRAHTMRGNG